MAVRALSVAQSSKVRSTACRASIGVESTSSRQVGGQRKVKFYAFVLAMSVALTATTALAFRVYGSIGEKYNALRREAGPLGPPQSDEADAPHGGRFNRFQYGFIYYHPKIGRESFAVYGKIGEKWTSYGGAGSFGYPVTDELPVGNGGRYNDFRKVHVPGMPIGSIYFKNPYGAVTVFGLIRDRWIKEGGATGRLGFPTADEADNRAGNRVQTFEKGQIVWHNPRAVSGKRDGSTEVFLGPPTTPTPGGPTPSTPPTGESSGVPAEWSDMLAAHNEKRKLHCAPSLVWDAGLAAAAQAHANKCTNTHGSSGENLAFFTRTQNGQAVLPAASDRVAYQNAWYCEVKQYNFDNPVFAGGFTQNCNPPTNGHFTQVVWKASRRMGCGRATCTINGSQGTYWVCRYDPPGNNTSQLRENVSRPSCN